MRGLDGKNETCRRKVGVSLPPWEIVDRYGGEEVRRLRHLMEEDIERGREGRLSEVVVLSKGLFGLAFDTLVSVCLKSAPTSLSSSVYSVIWDGDFGGRGH